MNYSSKAYVASQYADSKNLEKRIRIYRYSTNPVNWYEWVFARLPLKPGSRIVEFACGNGNLWRYNLERIPEGADILLTDSSLKMIEACKDNLGPDASRFRFETVDLSAVPEWSGMDLAIANHALYHVEDISKALRQVYRILSPSGRFAATTIGLDDNRELAELFVGYDSRIEFDPSAVARSFGLENGRGILERVFRDVDFLEYESRLEITDPSAILDYAMSLSGIGEVVRDTEDFLSYIERSMTDGVFRVTKRTGLFLCSP